MANTSPDLRGNGVRNSSQGENALDQDRTRLLRIGDAGVSRQ
jgi:hypothetical protein